MRLGHELSGHGGAVLASDSAYVFPSLRISPRSLIPCSFHVGAISSFTPFLPSQKSCSVLLPGKQLRTQGSFLSKSQHRPHSFLRSGVSQTKLCFLRSSAGDSGTTALNALCSYWVGAFKTPVLQAPAAALATSGKGRTFSKDPGLMQGEHPMGCCLGKQAQGSLLISRVWKAPLFSCLLELAAACGVNKPACSLHLSLGNPGGRAHHLWGRKEGFRSHFLCCHLSTPVVRLGTTTFFLFVPSICIYSSKKH